MLALADSQLSRDHEWAISSKARFADNEEKYRIMAGLRWLGFFSNDKITPRGTPLDTLCATLEAKMEYGPSERDMVMLQQYVPLTPYIPSQNPTTNPHDEI